MPVQTEPPGAVRADDPPGGGGLPRGVLASAFRGARVGLGVCDEDGRFVAVNDYLAQMLQRDRHAMLGRPFLTFVHPEHRAASLACYFRSVVAAAGSSHRGGRSELRCVTGAGAAIWVEISWMMTESEGTGDQYGILHLTPQQRARRTAKLVSAAPHRNTSR